MIEDLRVKHRRPSAEEIFNGINKNIMNSDAQLDISLFKTALDALRERQIICNRGRDGLESFYIEKNSDAQPSSSLQNAIDENHDGTIDLASKDVSETPADLASHTHANFENSNLSTLNNSTVKSSPIRSAVDDDMASIDVVKLNDLVNARLDRIILERINCAPREEICRSFQRPELHNQLIDTLKSENSFLKSEIIAKNKIIDRLLSNSCKPKVPECEEFRLPNASNQMTSEGNNSCLPVTNDSNWHIAAKKHSFNQSAAATSAQNTVHSNTNQLRLSNRFLPLVVDNDADFSTSECNLSANATPVHARSTKISTAAKEAPANRRRIVFLGDSLLKSINQNSFRKSVARNDFAFVKSFSGSNISDLRHHIQPSLRHNPTLIGIHIGTNELRSSKDADFIANEIISLARDIKTDENEVILSSIVVRRDSLNAKGMAVNKILKAKCGELNYGYCDNSNIKLRDLNQSGLHLSEKGTWQLATNFVNFIKI